MPKHFKCPACHHHCNRNHRGECGDFSEFIAKHNKHTADLYASQYRGCPIITAERGLAGATHDNTDDGTFYMIYSGYGPGKGKSNVACKNCFRSIDNRHDQTGIFGHPNCKGDFRLLYRCEKCKKEYCYNCCFHR